MEAGPPLAYYLKRRLMNLFRRRYSPHWRQFNVFLCGAAISQKQKIGKHPVHLEVFILKPDGHRELHWGVTYWFRYPLNPRVDTKGYVKVVDDVVQIFSSSWNDNRLATAGGDSWTYELADPDCVEKVIGKFKRMFPIPVTARK